MHVGVYSDRRVLNVDCRRHEIMHLESVHKQ
jgi:hypothetical protein